MVELNDYLKVLQTYNFIGGAGQNVITNTGDIRTFVGLAGSSYVDSDHYLIKYHFLTDFNDFNTIVDGNYYSTTDIEYVELPDGQDPSLNAQQVYIFQSVLNPQVTDHYSNTFSDVANVIFDVGTTADSHIIVGQTTSGTITDEVVGYELDESVRNPDGSSTWGSIKHGDVWLNQDYHLGWNQTAEGTLQYFFGLHEIAHSLGLEHIFAYDLASEGKEYLDSNQYTVTSYTPLAGMHITEANGTTSTNDTVFSSSLQLLDIAAIQAIYGANWETRNEDNTQYSKATAFASSRPNDAFVYTIWDGGGIGDTIDASGFTNGVTINLNEGEFSSIGKSADAAFDGERGLGLAVDNVAIAYGAKIENAVGTDDADNIIGNRLDNVIDGRGGDQDTFNVGYDDSFQGIDSGFGLGWLDGNAAELEFNSDGSMTLWDGYYDGKDTLYNVEIVTANKVVVNDANLATLNDLIVAGSHFYELDYSAVTNAQDFVSGQYATYIIGTNAGDDYDVGNGVMNAHTGTGNDTVTVLPGGGSTVTYTGGNDIYVGGASVNSNDELIDYAQLGVSFGIGIDINDVSIIDSTIIGSDPFRILTRGNGQAKESYIDVTLDVAGRGTIDLNTRHYEFGSSQSPDPYYTFSFSDGQTLDLVWNSDNVEWDLIAGDYTLDTSVAQGGSQGDVITGNAFDNDIFGAQGADTINGGSGNEKIHGGIGNDTIHGGAGDDLIVGGRGNDLIYLGIGDDVIGGDGEDIYIAEVGSGTTTIHDFNVSEDILALLNIEGANDFGSLDITTSGDDLIIALSANQTLRLNDVSLSDFANANLVYAPVVQALSFTPPSMPTAQQTGTAGNDVIDAVYGGDGEVLYGLGGNDQMYGSFEGDYLYGGDGTDDLSGYEGNDVLIGGDGDDFMEGGYGDDFYIIDGDDSNVEYPDVIYDEGGQDVIILENVSVSDLVIQTSGSDLLIQDINYNWEGLVVFDYAYDSDYAVEYITVDGDTYAISDVLVNGWANPLGGSSAPDFSGNDTVEGSSANDTLFGFAGNDILTGGAGDDLLLGGLGDDTYTFETGDGNNIIRDEGGFDSIQLGAGITQSDLMFTRTGNDLNIIIASGFTIADFYSGNPNSVVEQIVFFDNSTLDLTTISANDIIGTESADNIYGTQDSERIFGLGGHDYILGNDGDDFIYGGDGDDYLYGNGGTDTIYGENGDDRISGHAESDTLYGGDGVDRIYGYENSDLIYGGSGSDKIYGDDQDGLDTYTLGGADEIHGEDGNDQIFAGVGDDVVYGDAGADDLYGHAGNDMLYGGSGNDRLYGGDGNDTFYGGDDSDTIWAGSGDDIIIGGNGRDYLNGEAGADTFYLDLDEVDRVRDFDQGEGDKINIADLLDGYDSGTDDVNDFVDIVIRSSTRTDIRVDEDGQGGNFQYVGIIYSDLTGETVDSLVASGALITE